MGEAERHGMPIDMRTIPCSFCGGIGTMREEKWYQSRMVDEDEFTEHKAIVGERCPMCAGRGVTGVVGGFGPLSS